MRAYVCVCIGQTMASRMDTYAVQNGCVLTDLWSHILSLCALLSNHSNVHTVTQSITTSSSRTFLLCGLLFIKTSATSHRACLTHLSCLLSHLLLSCCLIQDIVLGTAGNVVSQLGVEGAAAIKRFVQAGGTVYSSGKAALVLEKLGLLNEGTGMCCVSCAIVCP